MSDWGERTDGPTQAQRSLAAMAETEDVATRQSLWCLALTYRKRDREAAVGAAVHRKAL